MCKHWQTIHLQIQLEVFQTSLRLWVIKQNFHTDKLYTPPPPPPKKKKQQKKKHTQTQPKISWLFSVCLYQTYVLWMFVHPKHVFIDCYFNSS